MKKFLAIIITSIYMLSIVYMPVMLGTFGVMMSDGSIAFADTTGTGTDECYCPPEKLCNPLLCEYNTLCKVLTRILELITQIGAIIAVVLIIWTGFKFITAQGNASKLNDAKKSFLTVIIGTALILGASAIAQIVVKTIFTITNKDNPGIC